MIKSNNFEQLPNYFIQKSLVSGLSLVKENNSHAPEHVVLFLLNLLRYNDNTKNTYNDCFYLATAIDSLSFAIAGQVKEMRNEPVLLDRSLLSNCFEEIERFRLLDLLFPSFRNIITVSCIKALIRFSLCGLIQFQKDLLYLYSRKGNYVDVRLAAIEGLILLYSNDQQCMVYIFEALKFDNSKYMKESILRMLISFVRNKVFQNCFLQVITKDDFWYLIKISYADTEVTRLLIQFGHYLFRSMDYPSDEITAEPMVVLPNISYLKITSLLREDKHVIKTLNIGPWF